eukprot:13992561-Alexandrium_andersonii.AAC.1
MSASLVGSGDVYKRQLRRSLRRCRTCRRNWEGERTGGAYQGVPGSGPVSYTHLTLPTICSV